MHINTIISSTGSYIPEDIVSNESFEDHRFLDKSGQDLPKSTHAIIEKMLDITEIEERRYANDVNTTTMASLAGKEALDKSALDMENLGGIIVAHNFGDIEPGENHGHLVPNLAAKVKHDLNIKNSNCFAYDVLFGCPGWLLALDQAHQYIQNGRAESVLVIGVEALSRVIDPNDIDSMLFGDAAGAALLTAEMSDTKRGILGYHSHSDCGEEIDYLKMSKPIEGDEDKLFLHMNGRNVFKYAVNHLPVVISDCLKSLSIPFEDVKQFFLHQANGKMLKTILERLKTSHPASELDQRAPMNLHKLGNTSVATIPTLLDAVLEGQYRSNQVQPGDHVVMASVGAGMHANCLVYQF